MSLNIRAATADDVGAIHSLMQELAVFEKLLDIFEATPESVREALFGKTPAAECLMAEWNGKAVGYALFFHNFSTFLGRRGLYLEDVYVQPSMRGKGVGRALLRRLARIAVERQCGRFEWTVLDWNQPAIDFYTSQGATVLPDWRVVRMTGEALSRFAKGE
ncbi:GNAT family N-acetyltransferase [Pandoraea apista]|uniref:GNAT family N-acetyltransferase n=1 Tax=Pandoraea apista TaxID=93218 RepID=A0ABX9ZSI6_9BURK|nr:GNAT family N-acetyltransferase [Pandoraea apista]PTE01428.1 GNAT family N-acetyltransferase [Pandoraea apista]RRJ30959.1 GNAT family N-acetyltransferase [Pandoraea apista]RRJ79567.1 GNAT family N-acetyltransferase [Pandoraea apista]RSD12333.1 GNAT family N-acetyltransferase [Pandoraea apista]RSD22566.1 GNAT family N-acetyltransferase [Pandoraea apista]